MQTPEETLEQRPARAATSAGCWCRCCATSASPPLRVGLPDPARRRREAARRPAGRGSRLHRSARLGRGLSARRRLDRPRSDLRPARRRRPHPARLHAGARRAPRRSPAPSTSARRRVRASTMTRAAHLRSPARHQALHRRAVGGDRRARRRASTRDLRRGDVRLTMGGEPTFVSIDDLDGAEWNTAALGPDEARARGRSRCGACATRFAPAACCTSARASGIRASRCRAGRSAATGGATASRCGRDADADRARAAGDYGATADRGAQRFLDARCASRLGVDATACMPAYEDAWLLPLARAQAARRTSIRSTQRLDDPLERDAAARASSSSGLERARRLRAAAAAPAREPTRGAGGAAGRGSCAREHAAS